MKACIHTHPGVYYNYLENGYNEVKARELGVSLGDINLIVKRGVYGLIVNNGNVYKYEALSLGSNLFCPIIKTF